MSLSPRQRNAVSALKMAVTRTKKELKSKEQVKTIVTYPKGLYKKTLAKNLDKTMDEVGLPNKNSKTGNSTAKRKPASRKGGMRADSSKSGKDGMRSVSKPAKKKTAAKSTPKKATPVKAAAKKRVTAKKATSAKPTAKKAGSRKPAAKKKAGLFTRIKKVFS